MFAIENSMIPTRILYIQICYLSLQYYSVEIIQINDRRRFISFA